MSHEGYTLEKQAQDALVQEKYEEAYKLFKAAAQAYRHENNHRQAALCFSSAASRWSIKSGERAFANAALAYEEAAREAQKQKALGYAALLYRHAAICHERDMEFMDFSECFYRSRDCQRKHLFMTLINPKEMHHISKVGDERSFFSRFLYWLVLTLSYLVWGYGERPGRTFFCGIALILFSAGLYMHGGIIHSDTLIKPNFYEGLYLSAITFSTVGYGDFTPVGIGKVIAMFEAFSGVFIVSMFTIGLSRKYLRL